MTTLSSTGSFVVTGLTTERSNRTDNIPTLNNPVGIASTQVRNLRIITKEMDLEILSGIQTVVDEINAKKAQIVSLSAQALGAFVPGYILPSCTLASDKDDIDTNVASYKDIIDEETGLPPDGITTPQIAYGVVSNDEIRIERYPKLEQTDASGKNPLEGLVYPILNSGNAGDGKRNLFFKNNKYTEDDFLTIFAKNNDGEWSVTDKKVKSIGRYYEITGPGTGSITIRGVIDLATSVFTVDAEYESIISQFTGVQIGVWTQDVIGTPENVSWNTLTGEVENTDGLLVTAGPGSLQLTSATDCTGIKAQIDTLKTEITQLRKQVREDLEDGMLVGTNIIKERKHGQQLRVWSGDRIKITDAEQNVGITSAINDTIQVDPNLPEFPEDTIDHTNITVDDTELTIDTN